MVLTNYHRNQITKSGSKDRSTVPEPISVLWKFYTPEDVQQKWWQNSVGEFIKHTPPSTTVAMIYLPLLVSFGWPQLTLTFIINELLHPLYDCGSMDI